MTRIGLVVVLLLVTQGAVLWIRQGFVPAEVKLPDRLVNDLPLQLATWSGEDLPVDPRLFQALESDLTINRVYRKSGGDEVLLHSVMWTDMHSRTPHLPELCYRSTGWQITSRKQAQIEREGRAPIPVQLLTLARDDAQILVLWWYQMGDAVYFDTQGMRQARQQLWGKPHWPPVIKVMLQTTIDTPSDASRRLRDFGGLVLAWTDHLE